MGLFTGSLDMQSADPILKELYTGQKVMDLTYPRNPALGMVPKFEGFAGRNLPIPIQYGMPQGRSATFANAIGQITPVRFKEFLLTRKKDYSLATIDGETIQAANGDSGSFIKAMTVEIDGALASLAASQSTAIFRNGTGSIGQVFSVTGNAIVLTNAPDVTCFECGMSIQANATDGGATPRAGVEIISAINRSTGTLTSTSTTWATTITAIAANDYLVVQGDNNAKMTGFDAWIPLTPPTPGVLYYGVDRFADSRLFGQVYDARNGDNMEEACINAQSQAAREGGGIDNLILNPIRMRDLQKGAQTKTFYQRTTTQAQGGSGESAKIGYAAIIIDGDSGPIKVWADPRCPVNVGWALTMDTWTLNSAGPAQQLLENDGLRIQRDPTSDSYTVRTGGYLNLGCNAPGFNIRIQFA